jgi:NAD(P)-dependent dehydrogenase (short-subunit alcohol dehydrogenase family)
VVSARHNRRRAVVTGGARGIGVAIAARLAADGADVVIADIQSPSLTDDRRNTAPPDCESVECDVSSEDSVAVFAPLFLRERAGAAVDVQGQQTP